MNSCRHSTTTPSTACATVGTRSGGQIQVRFPGPHRRKSGRRPLTSTASSTATVSAPAKTTRMERSVPDGCSTGACAPASSEPIAQPEVHSRRRQRERRRRGAEDVPEPNEPNVTQPPWPIDRRLEQRFDDEICGFGTAAGPAGRHRSVGLLAVGGFPGRDDRAGGLPSGCLIAPTAAVAHLLVDVYDFDEIRNSIRWSPVRRLVDCSSMAPACMRT